MYVRRTLKELGELAIVETGFCVGIYWRSVTGRRVPEGMISPNCRLAYVLFTGFDPAYRFHTLLTRQGVERLPRHRVRLVRIQHDGQTAVGVAVVAVVSPDTQNATGFRRAPACEEQVGYQRYFRELARARSPQRPWWDSEIGDAFEGDRFAQHELRPGFDYAERQADEQLERELDRIEADYNEKLWWYGEHNRRTKYPPALGSVQELFAYARKQELDSEEFARRNRYRQSEQWLNEQRERDRQRQQELDADQAEIAGALSTPRRGRKHGNDQDWLATQETLKARKAIKHIYRDAAPRPPRPDDM